MIIVMHMSILSCGALFLGPRLPRPGKGPQVTRRMFSVIFFIAERLLLLSASTSPRTHPGEVEGRLCKGDWKGVLDTQLTFVLAKVLASSERANAVVSIKILKVETVFNLYGLDSDISGCLLLLIYPGCQRLFMCGFRFLSSLHSDPSKKPLTPRVSHI